MLRRPSGNPYKTDTRSAQFLTRTLSQRPSVDGMMDLIFLLTTVGFFGLMFALLSGMSRL